MTNRERRTRTKRATLIAVALLLAVYLISSTYARYSTQGLANATVDVAKWAVAMTSGGTTLSSTTQNITFVVQSNSNVVPGKIAPAVTAVATIQLDLTGTEVAVDFTASVGSMSPNNLPSSDKISLSSAIDGTANSGAATIIPLENNAAFTSSNGIKVVTLTLTWTNDDNNNVNDTATGMLADGSRTITIPVTLTVQQHIS